MIYPVFPKSGDTIGICAPSAGVGHKLESFDLSLDSIKEHGFKVVETASVRSIGERSAEASVRANEFHSLLTDSSVRTIIAATGGDYNYEVLPYINEELIRSNPKWVCGYSDPTNILYYMTTKLDIATIYGVNAGSFDWQPLHEYQKNALDIISGDLVDQHSYEFWDSTRDWENVALDTPVSWDAYFPGESEPNTRNLDVSGRIIGGCTDIISKLIGTPYDGTADFIERYADDGFIWYFDTFDMSADILYLTMLQFKYAGYFKNARAVIMGRVMFPGESTDAEYVERLQRVFTDTNTPFIWGADIGHTKPAMTMINGAIGKLHCSNGKCALMSDINV